jgi:hypothetical protein
MIFIKMQKNEEKNYSNFGQLIHYTKDRIYCAGECNGRFIEEINKNVIGKVEKYLSTHDPFYDIDENGNSPLHLIAKNGLYELFLILKKHPSFDQLRNLMNKRNETALDLAKLGGDDVYVIISPDNYINSIPTLVTIPYYDVSFPKLVKEMEDIHCLSNLSLKDMYLSKIKQNIEQLSIEQSNEQTIEQIIEKRRLKYSLLLPFMKQTDEDIQREIDYNNQLYKDKIAHLHSIMNALELSSDEEIKEMLINAKNSITSFFQSIQSMEDEA